MNDCFLFWIGICEGEDCNQCPLYISVNSEEGDKLCQEYDNDVEEALKPVRETWSQKLKLK